MASKEHKRLCTLCAMHFDDPHTVSFEKKGLHHADLDDLEAAANNGCYICVRIYMDVKKTASTRDERPKLRSLRYRLIRAGDDRVLKLLFDARLAGYKVESVFFVFEKRRYLQTRLRYKLPPTTGDAKCMSLAKNWLSQCRAHHKCWKDRSPSKKVPKPTRLLHVYRKVDGDVHVRLCHGIHISGSIEYLTLSHTWGEQKFLTLTRENHAHFLVNIDFSALSRTFQDALYVTMELGFKYLWIDSLCILQDDAQDWTLESERMAHVYRNAVCNICAAVSESAMNGFLPIARMLDPVPPVVHFDEAHPGKSQTLSESQPWGPLRNANLYRRAWVCSYHL